MRKLLALFISLTLLDGGLSKEVFSDSSPREAKPIYSSFSDFLQKVKADLEPFVQFGQTSLANPDKPFFILLRDLHCNYEAQLSIAKAIEVVASYQLSVSSKNNPLVTGDRRLRTGDGFLVLTEGADGPEDTSLLGTFPDKKVREEGSRAFMKEGKMTGAEFLSITRYGEIPIHIEGVEDADLYIENLKAFQKVIGKRDDVKSFIAKTEEVLNQVKEKIYSPELVELEAKEHRYQEGKENIAVYGKYIREIYLKSLSDQGTQLEGSFNVDFPNLALFLEMAQAHQEISAEEVEKERVAAMETLSQKLPKEELATLIKQALEYRLGKVTGSDYWKNFFQLVQKNLDVEKYKTLAKYAQLMGKESLLNHETLLDEIEKITQKSKERLMTKQEEKEVASFSKRLELLKRLLNLEMSRDDLEFYQACSQEADIGVMLKQLKEFSEKCGVDFSKKISIEKEVQKISSLQAAAQKFYELALKRDEMMAGKALRAVDNKLPTIHYPQITVLITGGFHSSGVAKILKEAGAGFIILTPRIKGQIEMTNYFQLMMHEQLRMGTLDFIHLFGQKLAQRFPEMVRGMMEEAINEFIALATKHKVSQERLVEWFDELVQTHNEATSFIAELKAKIVSDGTPPISPSSSKNKPTFIHTGLQKQIIDALVVREKPEMQASAKEHLEVLFERLNASIGPSWFADGRICGNLAGVRILVELMEQADLSKPENRAQEISKLARELFCYQVFQQILSPILSDRERESIIGSLPEDFKEKYGPCEAEEILARFLTSLITGKDQASLALDRGQNLFEDVSLDLEEALRGKTSLATIFELIDEMGSSESDRERVVQALAAQVSMTADEVKARASRAENINHLVQAGSVTLRAWEKIQKIIASSFEGKRPRAYVFEIQNEQELIGLAAAYRQMRSVDKKGHIILNTSLDKGVILKWMRTQGLSEELLGKEIHVIDLAKRGRVEELLVGIRGLEGATFSEAQTDDMVFVVSSEESRTRFQPRQYKVLIGQLGESSQWSHLVPDAMGMALILGSVDKAFDRNEMTNELRKRLEAFLIEIAREYFTGEEDQDREVQEMINEIAENGYFKMPPWTNPIDLMMNELAAQEMIETSA